MLIRLDKNQFFRVRENLFKTIDINRVDFGISNIDVRGGENRPFRNLMPSVIKGLVNEVLLCFEVSKDYRFGNVDVFRDFFS